MNQHDSARAFSVQIGIDSPAVLSLKGDVFRSQFNDERTNNRARFFRNCLFFAPAYKSSGYYGCKILRLFIISSRLLNL